MKDSCVKQLEQMSSIPLYFFIIRPAPMIGKRILTGAGHFHNKTLLSEKGKAPVQTVEYNYLLDAESEYRLSFSRAVLIRPLKTMKTVIKTT